MRSGLLLLAVVLTGGIAGPSCQQEDHPLSSLLSKELYEKAFPHHHAIYTYEALIKAAASFPLFAGEGDPVQRKRELAAFFAHIGHETANEGGPDEESEGEKTAGGRSAAEEKAADSAAQIPSFDRRRDSGNMPGLRQTVNDGPSAPYTWGLYYTEEQACLDGHCTQYNTAGTSPYQPVPGKSYHGRGPLQLTYAYNYGLAGEELGLPLLEKPELVSHDGVDAFRTALWFWMKAQQPKPSCHEVVCGQWQPTAEDLRLRRKPGFGMTINIINGGQECATDAPEPKDQREERIGYYKRMAALLQVSVEKDCDCADMTPY